MYLSVKMGKRRTNAPHKDRYAGGDSDESEGEDEVVEQPELNQEQLASIKTRKKLIARRRGQTDTAASSFGVTNQFIWILSVAVEMHKKMLCMCIV